MRPEKPKVFILGILAAILIVMLRKIKNYKVNTISMIQKFDKRNENIKVWIDGTLYHRNEAKISVFDSLSQGGDAVWGRLKSI